MRDVEGLSETEILKRTKFNLADFLKKNEGIREGLADRVSIGRNGRVQFQTLDKYRGDGAGNVDETGQFTPKQIEDFNLIEGAVRLYGTDRQGLKEFIKRFDEETLAAYRRYKRGE